MSPRISLPTFRVRDIPAEIAAEPPIVRASELQSARMPKALRCGSCSLIRVLKVDSSGRQSQKECLERGHALCRSVAEKLATLMQLACPPPPGGLNNFHFPDPFRVRVTALHNSETLNPKNIFTVNV